jgi:glycerate dehydrogenase
MEIVVLDNLATNPVDREWGGMSEMGNCIFYDVTPQDPEVIIERSKNAEALIVGTSIIDEKILSELPKLRYIGVTSTGYNVVDVEAAQKRGVVVTNVPDFSTKTVVEYVFSSIFTLIEKTHSFDKNTIHQYVSSNCWDKGKAYWTKIPFAGLAGKTMGVIGLGRVGSAVARCASAFGMDVLYYSRTKKEITGISLNYCELDSLFAEADILSLHCPLNEATQNMVSAQRLALMKQTAILINTARGGVVDEEALVRALFEGKIRGAALDVFTTEPAQNNPLFKLNNCLLSPHVAWASERAQIQLLTEVISNLRAYKNGEQRNVISDRGSVLVVPQLPNNKKRKRGGTIVPPESQSPPPPQP